MNRLTGKYYTDDGTLCPSSPTYAVSYTYDDGTYGEGRRTGMTDASGSTSWTYDQRGQVTQETRVIDGAGTFVTGYTYDAAGRVDEMTYPDGEAVVNTYNKQGLESLVGNTTYVEDVIYNALGQMTLMKFGAAGVNLQTSYSYNANNFRLLNLTTTGSISIQTIRFLIYWWWRMMSKREHDDLLLPSTTWTAG